jgi:hypothetical protein
VKRFPSGESKTPSMRLRVHRVRFEIPPNTVRRDRGPERSGSELTEKRPSGLPEAPETVYGSLISTCFGPMGEALRRFPHC